MTHALYLKLTGLRIEYPRCVRKVNHRLCSVSSSGKINLSGKKENYYVFFRKGILYLIQIFLRMDFRKPVHAVKPAYGFYCYAVPVQEQTSTENYELGNNIH